MVSIKGNNKEYVKDWIVSWACKEGNVNRVTDIMNWVEEIRGKTRVYINECSINQSTFWFYDDYMGEITNRKRSFFSIIGVKRFENNTLVSEQPIIKQPEIGYLGMICKKINGVFNFLIQAKVEPGNINYVQLSPTIQATKSNFMRVHGGKMPLYFEYFDHADAYKIVYDQIQSEQSSRFLKKRNRNIIIIIDEDIIVHENYMWMTLGQIKALMKIDNLVNMDTRTVISGIPLSGFMLESLELEHIQSFFSQEAFFNSIFKTENVAELSNIYHYINNYKMFQSDRIIEIPLYELSEWAINEWGIVCKKTSDFEVHYYDINIDNRGCAMESATV